ncbi:MAG: ABC-type Mn/Zn transport systems, ATPase component [uncultured Nocardioidaceae bacterium]|uniref:ABC-type Mn/Zn transport systems, ATPase component n=1 Tax=uncultured Nocardioidaceae bacterium TaxID=253824 RepID=A0A6J4LEL7_9ACTN|nr:MAG: ABC-type Mn/Zn transport systems, ATPase component [uncultured Nocardioidaceae bacterium]
MSQRNTLVRSMHDLGLAAWFGGNLMGAVGLNGAAAKARDPEERTRLSSVGWARWAPVNAAAIGVHLLGGVGLIAGNATRLARQQEGRANTAVKTLLTVAAMATTAYSGALGRKVDALSEEGGEGATEPSPTASSDLASAQKQLQLLQWVTPALTGALLVLGAQQGEQQRPLAGLVRGR